MSGIYIPGMEMPKSCRECEWCVHTIPGDKYICHKMKRAVIGVCETDIETVNVCCPLISVPDHGRLIDADKLVRDARIDTIGALSAIAEAKTVIKAVGGDL